MKLTFSASRGGTLESTGLASLKWGRVYAVGPRWSCRGCHIRVFAHPCSAERKRLAIIPCRVFVLRK